MFKVTLVVILIVCMSLVGCGKSMVIDGVERKTVGLIETSTRSGDYSEDVRYEPCWGNIILGVVLIETVIAPIYFFGFSMLNPVSSVNSPAAQGETVKH